MCKRCKGCKLFVMGVAIFLTAIYWPDYIWHVIGGLLILKSLCIFAKPDGCGCNTKTTTKPMLKKK